jgi:histidinol phosphatase-like enzyme
MNKNILYARKSQNRGVFVVICYTEQIVSCYCRNPLSLLWESILNKAVRQSQLKITNERPIMVPLDY